jgi:hypothetical protein
MRTLRRLERTLAILFVFFAIAACVLSEPASSFGITGTAGQNNGTATVTVTPTTKLVAGQTVNIHAEATNGSELFEIRAHLCAHNSGQMNRFKFSFDYSMCSPVALSPDADAETKVEIPPGVTTGDLAFRVGAGTGTWTTANPPYDPPEGATHTLTCGPDAPCNLVVALEVTNDTVFFTAPLCYGDQCPAEASPDGSPAPAAAAGSTGQAPPADTAAAAPPASTPAPAATPSAPAAAIPGSGSVASGTRTDKGAAAHSAGSTSAAASGQQASAAGNSDSSGHQGVLATLVGSPVAHRAARIFSAGAAGVLGGLLIALIVIRARRNFGMGRA